MSMNLIAKVGKRYIGFPFQTPTELTYAVIEAATVEEKLKLIKTQLENWGFENYKYIYDECVDLFNDTNVEITYL